MKKVRVSRPLRSLLSPLTMFMSFSLLLVLAGCGTIGPGETTPSVTITAAPASLAPGQTSTLTVAATDATTVTVTGSDGSSYNLSATGGTQAVKPAKTTTYTATASGSAGQSTAKAMVSVGTPVAPTVTIAASPASIAAGNSSTLTVAATNASGVTIAGSDGSSYKLAATGGTQTVKPTATATYTATATGSGGTVTATATVTVTASPVSPTVKITANPTSIAPGSSSTLTVAAAHATAVTITGSDGSSYKLPATGGTQAVSPSATTTYTATASGAAGTTPATATAIVTVTAPAKPTVSVTANPATITAGSNSTLTIVAANATSVTISPSNPNNGVAPTGGTLIVSPAATTTYTITASNAAGSATATVTVNVVPAPPPVAPTVTLSASPKSINLGSSTTLAIVATNADTLLLQGTDGTNLSSPGNFPPTGGTEAVSPTKNATYTATATGAGGTATATVNVTVVQPPTPTVTIAANPQSVATGGSSVLTVAATNATSVTISGTDGSSYTLPAAGGTQSVSPTATTTYTVTAAVAGANPVTASATVTVVPAGTLESINHVIFMLQENHAFDNYFGMLNPYRAAKGWDKGTDGTPYIIDGIDDKLSSYLAGPGTGVTRTITNNDKQGTGHTLYPFKSTCVDDMSSAWGESYADTSLGDYATTRTIRMNGFVSNADGFANSKCPGGVGPCTGFTDVSGDRAMGFYDQTFLNYYYYMASQFALSDRWFSPVSSKSIPNRIATFTGGTTLGVTQDPGSDDHFPQLGINTIFKKLDDAKVSWKIYYTAVNGQCDPQVCHPSGANAMPSTTFSDLQYSFQYLYLTGPCTGKTQPSSVVGDTTNSFCIDPTHIAPLRDPKYGYFADLANGTLPSFAFIESGSGFNDEHPGSGQSILSGQYQVSTIMNALMKSTSWKDSVFFFAYDEGGGPYDHVPPVPTHTNDWTDNAEVSSYPTDISTIAVNADSYKPCAPTTPAAPAPPYCDLKAGSPGTTSTDDPAVNGFAAQLGFRVPNIVISPFSKMHYVSHIPMDHTAVIKFVENRFIDNDSTGHGSTHLTARDAAQPNLLDFFDFTGVPWATPPIPPAPVTQGAPPGQNSCQPTAFH